VTTIITGGREISGKIFLVVGFILGIEASITLMMSNDLSFDQMLRSVCSIQTMFHIHPPENRKNYLTV
jgi:hypothetical protein